jgi:hypothetical protein
MSARADRTGPQTAGFHPADRQLGDRPSTVFLRLLSNRLTKNRRLILAWLLVVGGWTLIWLDGLDVIGPLSLWPLCALAAGIALIPFAIARRKRW